MSARQLRTASIVLRAKPSDGGWSTFGSTRRRRRTTPSSSRDSPDDELLTGPIAHLAGSALSGRRRYPTRFCAPCSPADHGRARRRSIERRSICAAFGAGGGSPAPPPTAAPGAARARRAVSRSAFRRARRLLSSASAAPSIRSGCAPSIRMRPRDEPRARARNRAVVGRRRFPGGARPFRPRPRRRPRPDEGLLCVSGAVGGPEDTEELLAPLRGMGRARLRLPARRRRARAGAVILSRPEVRRARERARVAA